MPLIRPITDLRNTTEISEICHTKKEPIFITKNGYGDMVIMSMETYNELLEARAKASEKGKMKDTMERAKLESELKDIQRLVDRIPPEVLAELKRQQRHTRER